MCIRDRAGGGASAPSVSGGGSDNSANNKREEGEKVISAQKSQVYKSGKKKSRGSSSSRSSSSRSLASLKDILAKQKSALKKYGLSFKTTKDLNRALAAEGVGGSRSSSLFKRISNGYKKKYKQKAVIVYNSPAL